MKMFKNDEKYNTYWSISIFAVLISVIFNVQNDCDEAYNYWEPLFFTVTGKESFQTWEYSPDYSLRSYFYLLILSLPSRIINTLTNLNMLSFYATRLFLGIFSAYTACSLAKSLSKCNLSLEMNINFLKHLIKIPIETIFFLLYVFSPAFFTIASNLTPSAVACSLTALYMAKLNENLYFQAIGCIAFGSIVLWPFYCAIGLPLAIIMIYDKQLFKFMQYSLFWGTFLTVPILITDTYYYGKPTLPFLNILKYNVFGSYFYSGTSSILYGEEPVTYYFKNLFLNFNIVIITTVILLPVVFLCLVKEIMQHNKNLYSRLFLNVLSSTIIWIAIFFSQPHKEERFLFPIYPCIVYLGAFCFMYFANFSKKVINHPSMDYLKFIKIVSFFIFFCIFSFSRITAIAHGYSAPINLLKNLSPSNLNSNHTLCLSRDWHLFPNRFILNPAISSVRFVKSSFGGILPSHFKNTDVSLATSSNGGQFNLYNKAESDRFLPFPPEDYCNYVLDRASEVASEEVDFLNSPELWGVWSESVIVEPKSKDLVSSFLRAFYVPKLLRKRSPDYVKLYIYYNKKLNKM